MTSSDSKLTLLLSLSPYLLAYSLPLFFISFAYTFSGTFLTLDRTRSFPKQGPAYASLVTPDKRAPDRSVKQVRHWWMLQGGVGGLMGGYAFGVHLATFLSLLIPATTSSSMLSPQSFLAIWVILCAVTTLLGGRYRLAAFAFLSISGGAILPLAISVILHPSLPPRIVLVSILTPLLPLFVVLSLFFLPAYLRAVLRVCTASTGAFGIVTAIALLLHLRSVSKQSADNTKSPDPALPGESWANAWERLWVRDGAGWGTSREKGLSAAFCIFFVTGIAVDWALKRWIGECPDEKWDAFLSGYNKTLSRDADRAGTFTPIPSLWDRLFLRTSSSQRDVSAGHTPDDELENFDFSSRSTSATLFSPPYTPPLEKSQRIFSRQKYQSPLRDSPPMELGPQRFKTASRSPIKAKKKPIKFGGAIPSSDSDSESTPSSKKLGISASSTPTLVEPSNNKKRRPKGERTTTTTTITFDLEDERERNQHLEDLDLDPPHIQNIRQGVAGETLEYSDWEFEDGDLGKKYVIQERPRLTKQSRTSRQVRDSLNVASTTSGGSKNKLDHCPLNRLDSDDVSPGFITGMSREPALIPVLATPSLMRAIERLNAAQHDAYNIGLGTHEANARLSPRNHDSGRSATSQEEADEEHHAPRWEEFWREVRDKARS